MTLAVAVHGPGGFFVRICQGCVQIFFGMRAAAPTPHFCSLLGSLPSACPLLLSTTVPAGVCICHLYYLAVPPHKYAISGLGRL